MAARPFRSPVLARIDDTSHYSAQSAWEALEYLNRYWIGPPNRLHAIAVKLCRDAVDGWIPPSRARHAFSQAVQSAGLLVRQEKAAKPKPDKSKLDVRAAS